MSKGKINIVYENPEPYSETEDRAVGFGLQAVPLGDTGEVAYFGLAATNATDQRRLQVCAQKKLDDQQVVPFFNLERRSNVRANTDLTKLIYSLSKPNQAKIGLMSKHAQLLPAAMGGGQMGMGGQQTPPWAIFSQIKDFFDVRELDGNIAEIPQDISLLMLVQPSNLTPAAQFAIDQFVLRVAASFAGVRRPEPCRSSGAQQAGKTISTASRN